MACFLFISPAGLRVLGNCRPTHWPLPHSARALAEQELILHVSRVYTVLDFITTALDVKSSPHQLEFFLDSLFPLTYFLSLLKGYRPDTIGQNSKGLAAWSWELLGQDSAESPWLKQLHSCVWRPWSLALWGRNCTSHSGLLWNLCTKALVCDNLLEHAEGWWRRSTMISPRLALANQLNSVRCHLAAVLTADALLFNA